MSYEHILKSDNPDSKLEYFWLTFKNSIMGYLNDEEKDEINLLSSQLNDLQKQERYDQIEEYIRSHIEKIGYSIIQKDDHYRAGHLDTNIKRWNKISGSDLFIKTNIFICIFRIFINLIKKSRTMDEEKYELTRSSLQKYSSDPSNRSELINLMNLSIEYEMYGNIDKLRNILDIEAFINPKHREKLSDAFIKNTKGSKICKYMHKLV